MLTTWPIRSSYGLIQPQPNPFLESGLKTHLHFCIFDGKHRMNYIVIHLFIKVNVWSLICLPRKRCTFLFELMKREFFFIFFYFF
jgi:hypothetical protein